MLTFPPLKIGFQKSLILAIVADIVDSIAPLSASRCILYLLYIVYFVFRSLRPFSPGIHSTKLFHFRSPSHPAITNPTIFSQKTSSPMENSLTSVWNLNVVIFLAQGWKLLFVIAVRWSSTWSGLRKIPNQSRHIGQHLGLSVSNWSKPFNTDLTWLVLLSPPIGTLPVNWSLPSQLIWTLQYWSDLISQLVPLSHGQLVPPVN